MKLLIIDWEEEQATLYALMRHMRLDTKIDFSKVEVFLCSENGEVSCSKVPTPWIQGHHKNSVVFHPEWFKLYKSEPTHQQENPSKVA